ncbi:MAG: hypothetical protein ACE5E9_03635 [Nitrospinaceae bacterium]
MRISILLGLVLFLGSVSTLEAKDTQVLWMKNAGTPKVHKNGDTSSVHFKNSPCIKSDQTSTIVSYRKFEKMVTRGAVGAVVGSVVQPLGSEKTSAVVGGVIGILTTPDKKPKSPKQCK